MEKKILSYRILSLVLSVTAVLVSCGSEDQDLTPNLSGPVVTASAFNCIEFSYADTLFFVTEQPEHIIKPVKALSGTFTAIPEGLAINSETGDIDINASESGLKYEILFSPTNGAPACSTYLTIGGINYLDQIFVLERGETHAFPVYNGIIGAAIPCEDDDDDDDDDDGDDDDDDSDGDDDEDDCEFDVPGPEGQKLADLGVSISSSNGAIDLAQTLAAGALGVSPPNGTFVDFRMHYRLSDGSQGALNHIGIRIYYYETLTAVPQSLLEEIEYKREQLLDSPSPTLRRRRWDNPRVRPRPPYLVIVSRFR